MLRLALLILVFMPLASSAADSLRILLTNDDGFEAPGIRAMHSALIEAGHDVYLIAPATQQSGAAASITSGGVRITTYEGNVWAVHGRPADAVRVGLGQVMKDNPPDLVVSGQILATTQVLTLIFPVPSVLQSADPHQYHHCRDKFPLPGLDQPIWVISGCLNHQAVFRARLPSD